MPLSDKPSRGRGRSVSIAMRDFSSNPSSPTESDYGGSQDSATIHHRSRGSFSTNVSPVSRKARSGSTAQPVTYTAVPLEDGEHHRSGSRPVNIHSVLSRLHVPRQARAQRRLASMAMLFLLMATTTVIIWSNAGDDSTLVDKLKWLGSPFQKDEPLCQFVSVVDAYRRDLAALRALHPSGNTKETVHASRRAHHTFSPTGHMVLSKNPAAPHPVPVLLELGEKRWEELLSRQSRSLAEAVAEYERRYKRPPPLGFDAWWEFAVENRVILPDEYDRIFDDLAPFRALPKAELKKRVNELESSWDAFTLDIREGNITVDYRDKKGIVWDGVPGWHETMPRMQDMITLFQPIAHLLPHMRATFSLSDEPQVYMPWSTRNRFVDAGLHGQHTTELDEPHDETTSLPDLCPPLSNLRLDASLYEGKSFIYDTAEALDVCQNPYIIPIHGLTLVPLNKNSRPRPRSTLVPIFSLAKTSINSDILVTPLEQFFKPLDRNPTWERKTDSRLAWRGSSTGIAPMSKQNNWRQAHRIRLHHFANNGSVAPLTYLTPDLAHRDAGLEGSSALGFWVESTPTNEAVDFFYDMKLAGQPIQCKEQDGTCKELEQEIEWATRQPASTLNKHKFLLDIDGNSWSGRFRRLLRTGSVVIKPTIFTEWHQSHLIPWFMYIPSKLDFTDLSDIMAFFRGTPKHPQLAFDKTAKAIGHNGQCFVTRMFRIEDLQAYMLRLFLEYARLLREEEYDMDLHSGEDAEDDENSSRRDDPDGASRKGRP